MYSVLLPGVGYIIRYTLGIRYSLCAPLICRLAHTALGQHREARECYQRALDMDPVNDSYKENLRQSEQSMQDSEAVSKT